MYYYFIFFNLFVIWVPIYICECCRVALLVRDVHM